MSDLYKNGTFNPSAIMAQAHKLVREENPILIERCGYHTVLGWKLKTAWGYARTRKNLVEADRRAASRSPETTAKIKELKTQIYGLECSQTWRVNKTDQIKAVRSELSELETL